MMSSWPKKTHWRECLSCKVAYRIPYDKKTGYHNPVCYVCRHQYFMRNFETLVLLKMTPSPLIVTLSARSVRPDEWFMKRELTEFIPYMVDKIGPELAKQVYANALNRYKQVLIRQWEQTLLFDIVYPQQ